MKSLPINFHSINRASLLLLIFIVLTACNQESENINLNAPIDSEKTSQVGKNSETQRMDTKTFSPRIIAYYNTNTTPILDRAEHLPYTHYILSFLVPDGEGGIKASKDLAKVLADKAALARVQDAGKKIMVSVGGGTVGGEDWLQMGAQAGAVADAIATVVEQYHLDGVDLDVEVVPYINQKSFQPYADAVIALTQAIAIRLPSKDLSHAPQPPYLCKPGSSGECPKDSLYATILAAAGEHISWINMQYYSNPPVTSSDIDEVDSYISIVEGWNGFVGLESSRLVLGKPYSSRVNGHEPIAEIKGKILTPLITKYGQSFGGFMAWEYIEDDGGTWAKSIEKLIRLDQ